MASGERGVKVGRRRALQCYWTLDAVAPDAHAMRLTVVDGAGITTTLRMTREAAREVLGQGFRALEGATETTKGSDR